MSRGSQPKISSTVRFPLITTSPLISKTGQAEKLSKQPCLHFTTRWAPLSQGTYLSLNYPSFSAPVFPSGSLAGCICWLCIRFWGRHGREQPLLEKEGEFIIACSCKLAMEGGKRYMSRWCWVTHFHEGRYNEITMGNQIPITRFQHENDIANSARIDEFVTDTK